LISRVNSLTQIYYLYLWNRMISQVVFLTDISQVNSRFKHPCLIMVEIIFIEIKNSLFE
jgi:hypothetical protein